MLRCRDYRPWSTGGALALIAFSAACDAPATRDAARDAPDATTPLTCTGHAVANLEATQCQCLPGYLGDACDRCAHGYVFSGGSCVRVGQCPSGCGHGRCNTTQSPGVCACDAGYAGSACSLCAPGFFRAQDGACEASSGGNDPPACAHGWLSFEGGTWACTCDDGYRGPLCDACADGFAHVWRDDPRARNDGPSEVCIPGCAVGLYACDHHGSCEDTNDGPHCACDAGFVSDGGVGCVPTAGASCADAAVLDLAVGAAETSIVGGSASLGGDCEDRVSGGSSIAWRARVFRMNLPTAERVRFRGVGVSGLTLSVRSTCDDRATQLACAYGAIDAPLEVDLLAGDTYLIVSGWDVFAGGAAIAAEVVCPAGQVFAWGAQACVADPCGPGACSDPYRHACRVTGDGGAACACDPGAAPRADGTCAPLAAADGSSCDAALTLEAGRDRVLTLPAVTAVERAVSSCESAEGGVTYLSLALTERSRVRVEAHASPRPALAVALREECARPTSELACQRDDGTAYALGSGPAATGAVLEAGVWTVVVDGLTRGSTSELRWDVAPDPCAHMQACAGGQVPTRAPDWSSCVCACPEGEALGEAGCVPSPCAPNSLAKSAERLPAENPCQGDKTRCTPTGAAYRCECPLGQVDDAAGGTRCVDDPSAAAWTVLVYESYDNNLGLPQIGGSTLTDTLPDDAPNHVVWLSSTPADNAAIFHQGMGRGLERVATWNRPDMGDWRTLRAFATWAAAEYPAHHYALVFVDHGGGLEFGWDTGAGGTFISIPAGDYAHALSALVDTIGARLDLVDFEMCLMTRWEVAEATRPFARSFLGSPEEAYGMSGQRIPALLAADPTQTDADLGRAVVATYAGPTPANIESWVDLDAAGAVTTHLDALASAMLERSDRCATYETHGNSCRPFMLGETDVGCFATHLADDGSLPDALRTEARAVADAVAASVVTQPPRTSGLAIALPPLVLAADTPATQRGLDPGWFGPGAVWALASHWDELVLACRGAPSPP